MHEAIPSSVFLWEYLTLGLSIQFRQFSERRVLVKVSVYSLPSNFCRVKAEHQVSTDKMHIACSLFYQEKPSGKWVP